jgi:hypothetical protein
MNVILDKDHIDEVEYGIHPPMKQVITIPASNGVVIYITTSPFGLDSDKMTDEELQAFARRVTIE